MSTSKVLVSVITPVYNSAKYITNSIESVLNQTHTNWELLLIDDCSTDNSVEIIKEFTKKDPRINLFNLSHNSGAAATRNFGIEKAKGDYIAFLDSDDTWHPEKLEKQLNFMISKNVPFTFTDYFLINETSGEKSIFRALKSEVNYQDITRFNYIACSTVLINVKETGKLLMPNLRNRQDWGLWIDIIRKNKAALRLNLPLAYYLIRTNSLSSNKLRMIQYHWLIYHKHLGFNLFKSVIFLIQNIFLHIKAAKKKI